MRAASSRIAVAPLCALLFCLAGAGARGEQRALSIDDFMRMEGVGTVTFALQDRALVYEWIEAYENAPNLGAIWDLFDRRVASKLYRAEVNDPGTSRPLFPQEASAGYWIGSRSPDSSRLAVYRLLGNELRAGVVDLASGEVRWFDFAPNYFWLHLFPVWLSNDEIAYPLLPPGRLPSYLFRLSTAARIETLWQRTFDGREPAATVFTSGLDAPAANKPSSEGELIKVNVRTGAITVLGQGYFYEFHLSADRRYLAALRPGAPLQPRPDIPVLLPNDMVFRQAVVFDLATGEAIVPCMDCQVALATLEWSKKDSELLFYGARGGDPIEAAGQWYRFKPRDRELLPLAVPGLQMACSGNQVERAHFLGMHVLMRARALPAGVEGKPVPKVLCGAQKGEKAREDWFLVESNGRYLNVTDRFAKSPEALAGLTGNAFFVAADGGGWRAEVEKSKVHWRRIVGRASGSWEGDPDWPRDHERRYLGKELPQRRATFVNDEHAVLIDFDRIGVRSRWDLSSKAALAAISDRGDLAVLRRAQSGASLIALADSKGDERTVRLVNEYMVGVAPGKSGQLTYQFRGKQVTSCLLLPPGWRADRRYPTIAVVYPGLAGGRCDESIERFDPHTNRLLAAKGYVVIVPYTGTDLIRTQEGPTAALTDAALAAVDAAIAAGYTDGERLAVAGFSQGMHSALQVITQTKRFRAAIAAFGVSDFVSQYGAMPLNARMGWDSTGVGSGFARFETPRSDNYVGGAPWEIPEAYVRNSPLFFADRVTTPLLLFNSDFDQFSINQSEEFFSALYRLRKPAMYVTYWGEGHFNWSPANIRDYWSRTFQWLEKYLLGPRQD